MSPRASIGAALAATIAFFLLNGGCSPKTPKLMAEPPPKPFEKTKALTTYVPKVDILFVIDNSGSMYSHQNRLRANIDKFILSFQKSKIVDYHIGVLTTDAYEDREDCDYAGQNGCLAGDNVRYVTRNTPNGLVELKDMLMPGTDGSGRETSFLPIKRALSLPNVDDYNKGFYRQDAHLAILFITDASEQSEMTVAQIQDFLIDLKSGDNSKVLTYGAIVPSNDTTNCPRDDSSSKPWKIEELIKYFNGSFYSLCDPNYGEKLASVADNVISRIGRYIYLDKKPILSTLRVDYGTIEIPNDYLNGWTFDPSRNALVIGQNVDWSTQPDGTTVDISFEPILTTPKE